MPVRILAVSVSLHLLGCWVPVETGEVMQRDIRALKTDLGAAQKSLDEQQAQLTEQIKRADDKLNELNRAARMTDADFGVQLEEIRWELQEIRGQVELTTYRLGQLETKLEGEGSLTARVEALEKQGTAATEPTAPPTPEAPKDKNELMAYGKKLAKQNKVAEARGVFRQLIRTYPKEDGITDEAFFQLGELYYREKKYRSALQEYIQVVEKFPGGPYADDAYYRIGVCSMSLGNLEDAQIFFEEIIKNHKKSPLVKHAKSKLKEVQQHLAKEKNSKKKRKK